MNFAHFHQRDDLSAATCQSDSHTPKLSRHGLFISEAKAGNRDQRWPAARAGCATARFRDVIASGKSSGGSGGGSLQNGLHLHSRVARASGEPTLNCFAAINPEAARGIPETVGGQLDSTSSRYNGAIRGSLAVPGMRRRNSDDEVRARSALSRDFDQRTARFPSRALYRLIETQ